MTASSAIERIALKTPRGVMSHVRMLFYRMLGLRAGQRSERILVVVQPPNP